MTTNERTVGRYLRWLLAALSVGAAFIHFAVSGGHYDISWIHGTFFAVVAWLQIVFAVGVVLRPTRRLLIAGVLLNAGIIGVWAVSRIWGVPVGPDAWTPESITLADSLSSGFEAGIVLLSLAVLVRPALAQHSIRPSFAIGGLGVTGLAVAVISTISLTPSFASDHHGGAEAAGHTHSAAADSGPATGGHTHGAIVSNAPTGDTPCEQSGPPASAGQISSAGGHGHRGPIKWQSVSDRATRDQLGQQLDIAHQVTLQHATVADAEADGYHMVTGYVPCIGAHYIKISNMIGGFDPAKPSMLLYDGTNPDSKIVGLSYLQFASKEAPPEGFAGANDPWHVHEQLCIGGGGVVGDESTTDEECAARGGKVTKLGNLWMTHMWNVPGWESRWGLFSSEHPDLGGVIGNLNAAPAEVAAAKAKAEAEKKQ